MPDAIRLGSVDVRLQGAHELVDLVRAELGDGDPPAHPAEVTIDISVGDGPLPAPPRSAVRLGPVTVAGPEAWMAFEHAGIEAHIRPAEDGRGAQVMVHVGPRPMPHHLPRWSFRWLEPTFLTPVQAQAYAFLLQIIEGSAFMFGGSTALLHASCVSRDGRAAMLTSTGGVGKTSTAARLMGRVGWRYLSDDICFLTPGGTAELHRRWPMVYAYNVKQQPALRRAVLEQDGLAGRVQWRAQELAHRDRRRRRVAPAALYGADRVGSKADLHVVAFLTRSVDDQLHIDEIDASDLARRCTAIILDEERSLVGLLRHWEAAGHPVVTVEDVAERHRTTYEAAFSGVPRLVHLRLPATGDVVGAADAVEDLVCRP